MPKTELTPIEAHIAAMKAKIEAGADQRAVMGASLQSMADEFGETAFQRAAQFDFRRSIGKGE